jgi:glycosyltransferase involved in cell wall biosynthesis
LLVVACIPAFNEENSIKQIIERTSKYVDKVVVCDDGSFDNTSLKATESGAHVIKHKKNLGKGAALQSLFQYAKDSDTDLMITIDGDGQFLPEEIPKLIDPIRNNNFDIVIGNRFDSETDMPSYRKIGNKFFDKMTNLSIDLPVNDTQSGFRAYSKNAINAINFSTNGFGADSEILINAAKKGLKITEEKITVIYNTGGKTSTKNPISHGGDVLGSLIELIALRHPLKYLGLPGIILLVIGIIYSVVVAVIFNDTRYFSIPSTLIALGSLMAGLMLFLMSIILFSINRAMQKL